MKPESRTLITRTALLGGGLGCLVGAALLLYPVLGPATLPWSLSELDASAGATTGSDRSVRAGSSAEAVVEMDRELGQLFGLARVEAVAPFRAGYQPPWMSSEDFSINGIRFDDPTGGEVPLQWVAASADRFITPGFRIRDFMTRDGAPLARISPRLVDGLERMRQRAGEIVILSGYRHPTHNLTVGGSADSQHQAGKAADIFSPSYSPVELAGLALEELGCEIGLGLGANSLHVDVRGELATWTYQGAPMRGSAFAVWVLTRCGMPVPPHLARRAAESWLNEDDEDSAEELLSQGGRDAGATAAEADPVAAHQAEIVAAAAAAYPRYGAGAVVLDLQRGALDRGPRYFPAGHRQVSALRLDGLVSWCASRQDGQYFAYAILRDGREPVTGVMNLSVPSTPIGPVTQSTAEPSPAQEEGWGIVVASVVDQATARRLAREHRARFESEGIGVYVSVADDRHRVILGPFQSQAHAQSALNRLSGQLPADAWLIDD